jgi:DNA-directed RNA polymerase subunit F
MKIVESRPVPLSEVKKLLSERKKHSELEYEQEQAADHADKFAKRTPEATTKLVKELTSKFLVLDAETALKLTDIAPKYTETIKATLLRKKVELNDEEMAELLKVLQ